MSRYWPTASSGRRSRAKGTTCASPTRPPKPTFTRGWNASAPGSSKRRSRGREAIQELRTARTGLTRRRENGDKECTRLLQQSNDYPIEGAPLNWVPQIFARQLSEFEPCPEILRVCFCTNCCVLFLRAFARALWGASGAAREIVLLCRSLKP